MNTFVLFDETRTSFGSSAGWRYSGAEYRHLLPFQKGNKDVRITLPCEQRFFSLRGFTHLAFTKSFASIVSRVIGLFYTPRKKPLQQAACGLRWACAIEIMTQTSSPEGNTRPSKTAFTCPISRQVRLQAVSLLISSDLVRRVHARVSVERRSREKQGRQPEKKKDAKKYYRWFSLWRHQIVKSK